MFDIEVWGLGISILGSVVAAAALLFPPVSVRARLLHLFYLIIIGAVCLVFMYLVYGSKHELAAERAKSEERGKLSTQAANMLTVVVPN
jgi:hypothetical protein